MVISLSVLSHISSRKLKKGAAQPHTPAPGEHQHVRLARDGHLVTSVGKMDVLAGGPTTVVCAPRTGRAGLLQTQRTS